MEEPIRCVSFFYILIDNYLSLFLKYKPYFDALKNIYVNYQNIVDRNNIWKYTLVNRLTRSW